MKYNRFGRLLSVLFAVAAADQAAVAQTSDEKAANGPIPGDVGLYASEFACAQKLPTPGYYQSLNGAELADAQRSGLYPCADFTGSFTANNKVYAWKSQNPYQGANFINNRKPGELYLVGGVWPALNGPVAPGPYVAKLDATTGAQIWRTYLENANIDKVWIAVSNLNILPNGNIVAAWSNKIVLIDGDTGLVLRSNSLPTGAAAVSDTNFKHVTIAPDGTLILKDQARPAGEAGQGSMAAIKGVQAGLKMANSEIVAVDPNSLDILDAVPVPEPAASPHVITSFAGKTAIYVSGNAHAFRYFWDPQSKKLSRDRSWAVAYVSPGQSTGTAPSIIGDWITILTNGIGSRTVASSVVAINQKDPTKVTTIFPFGPLRHGISFAPPKNGTDPENNMLYAADMGMGKVAGIKLDHATGTMKTAFVVDDTTSGLQTVIGPKDKRVLIVSNVRRDFPFEGTMVELMTHLYREQVIWRDAATGRILAASDFFPPMIPNALLTPGFGGRVYYVMNGGFMVLQVKATQ
jgi:hypothetical protein